MDIRLKLQMKNINRKEGKKQTNKNKNVSGKTY